MTATPAQTGYTPPDPTIRTVVTPALLKALPPHMARRIHRAADEKDFCGYTVAEAADYLAAIGHAKLAADLAYYVRRDDEAIAAHIDALCARNPHM